MKKIDMHCDTLTRLDDNLDFTLLKNDLQVDLLRLKKADVTLQNFAIFIDKEQTTDTYQAYRYFLKKYRQELATYSDLIQPMLSYQDYLDNQSQGKMSAMLTLEEGAPLNGKIERLHQIYQDGVRMLTLTWNYPNEIGMPNMAYYDEKNNLLHTKQDGLSEKGIAIVQEMAKIGMIIDASHASDQVVRDVLNYTTVPFVASHSNARAVTYHPRNLPNHLIKQISERGGVIGINFCELFLRAPHSQRTLMDALVTHIHHLIKIGGCQCIGLGADFDGIPVNAELKDVLSFQQLYQALEQSGLKTCELEAFFYKNVERLYQTLLI